MPGAYGGEIGEITEWVDVVTCAGEIGACSTTSSTSDTDAAPCEMRGWRCCAGLRLTPGDAAQIHCKLCDTIAERCGKQPVCSPSAGSIFKRPEGDYAGRLLEAAGAKGMRVGRAAVSTKHANFVVNLGGATAADVIKLIENVRALVYEKFGVLLEPEVCFVGEDAHSSQGPSALGFGFRVGAVVA